MNDKLANKEEFPIGETDQVFYLAKKIYNNFGNLTSGTIKEYAPTPFKAFAIAPRLISAYIKGEFWLQLNSEIHELASKGKIDPEYFKSEQAKVCYQEMANAFEDPSLDEEKFNALKNIFIKAFTENGIDRDSVLPKLYMRTVISLSSDEIYFLSKCYKKVETKEFKDIYDIYTWNKKASDASGFPMGAISKFEKTLLSQGLLGDRINSDRSGIENRDTFRLTDFAIELCQFMLEPPDLKQTNEH